MGSEKRRFFRHPIKVPIRLSRIEAQTSVNARAEDLSQGGLSFLWPDFISEGTTLQLAIPFGKLLFKMNTRVAHSQKDADTGLFKIGVSFEDSASAFRAKLAEEIIQIRQYREKMSLLRGRQFSEEEAAQMWIDRNAVNFAKAMQAS